MNRFESGGTEKMFQSFDNIIILFVCVRVFYVVIFDIDLVWCLFVFFEQCILNYLYFQIFILLLCDSWYNYLIRNDSDFASIKALATFRFGVRLFRFWLPKNQCLLQWKLKIKLIKCACALFLWKIPCPSNIFYELEFCFSSLNHHYR